MFLPPRPWPHPADINARLPGAGLALSVALLCCSLGAQLSSEYANQAKVTAVRFWSLDDSTRIAIEATGQFQFKADRLDNPGRLFFDLTGTRPDFGPKNSKVIQVGDRRIRQIRVAETQHGVTRIVLDLASDVRFSTSQLANPDRLIVDVRPNDHAAGVRSLASAPSSPERVQNAVGRASDALAGVSPSLPPATPSARVETVDPGPSVTPLSSPSRTTPEIGLPARRTPRADNTMTRVLGLKLRRVVIDAGHGGNDTGTIADDGLREKDIALDVAKRLGAIIQDRLGSEVIYTRIDDTFVPLSRRTAIANEANADLFLSIHVNSSPARAASGVETFYLSFTTSRSALNTAARENAGAEQNISDLQELLQKIALKDKVDESREFASRIQTSLGSLARGNHSTRDRGIKKAPFVVLIGAKMPSVLVEIGFITNSQDEVMMRRPEHRQRLAEALYRGVSSYANGLSHFQVAQQTTRPSGQQ